MHGGKLFWMIDRLYAEMDSLQRSQNEFIAFDRGLELDEAEVGLVGGEEEDAAGVAHNDGGGGMLVVREEALDGDGVDGPGKLIAIHSALKASSRTAKLPQTGHKSTLA